MYFSTRTFVTVLLAAAAHNVSAAPQKRQAIPPDVLASQASSAAAAASSIAAANEAAASGGLRPLPGLQQNNEAPASLRPLPGLQQDNGAQQSLRPLPGLEGGDVVTTPAVLESTTAEPAVATNPPVLVTPTQPADVISTSASLRLAPGLDTAAPAAPTLLPLPGVDSSAPALDAVISSEVPVVIGSFSQIVAEETSTEEVIATPTDAAVVVETSAVPVIGETTAPAVVDEVAPTTSAAVVIGSFSVIGADLLATTTAAAAETSIETPVETTLAQLPVETNLADNAAGIVVETPSSPATASLGFFTPIVLPSSAAAGDVLPTDTVLTSATLNLPIPIPTQGLVFTNTSIIGGVATSDGVASPTGGLLPIPGLQGNGAGAAAGTLQPLPGVAAPSGSLRPLPGVTDSAGSLLPLPTGSDSSATETLLIDDSFTTAGPDSAVSTDAAGNVISSALTTLTTVDSNGQATTLVTAVAVTSSAIGSEATSLGGSNRTNTNTVITAGASGLMGDGVASLMTLLSGAVLAVLLL